MTESDPSDLSTSDDDDELEPERDPLDEDVEFSGSSGKRRKTTATSDSSDEEDDGEADLNDIDDPDQDWEFWQPDELDCEPETNSDDSSAQQTITGETQRAKTVKREERHGRKTKPASQSKGKTRKKISKELVLCSKGCGQSFPHPGPSERHLMYCLGPGPGPYKCDLCPATLRNPKMWRRHKQNVHSEKGTILCVTCGKRISKGAWSYHIGMHAGGDRSKHICETCGAKFTTRAGLQKHSRTHTGERPFACSQCGRRFKAQPTLRAHETIHTGCICEHCGATFGSMWHLRNHRLQEHADAATSNKRIARPRQPDSYDITGGSESDSNNAPPPGPTSTSTPDECETPSSADQQQQIVSDTQTQRI